jgi:hypothetical protein
MPRDFYPRPEHRIVSFTRNFAEKIAASWERWNLPESKVAEYGPIQAAFEQAYLVLKDPDNKTAPNTARKNQLKRQLERATRGLAGALRQNRAATPADRISLGIRQLPFKGARVPTPDTMPIVLVKSAEGRTIELQIVDSDSPHRLAVPKRACGVSVFAWAGSDAPPEDFMQWPIRAMTSKSKLTLHLNGDLPRAARVLVVARWIGRTFKPGPWSRVITVYLRGGPPMPRFRSLHAA